LKKFFSVIQKILDRFNRVSPYKNMATTVIEEHLHEVSKVQPEMFPILRRDLVFEDDEPMESTDHRDFMNNLIYLVRSSFGVPNHYFVAGNAAVYFSTSQIKNKSFKAPDFILVKNIDGTKHREGWIVWEEGYKFPDLIIELLSPSTEDNDLGPKKDLYEQLFRTPEYFVCDPFDPDRLQGWRLNNGVYVKITPNENGWLWSEELGFYLGYWKGSIVNQYKNWLRFYDQYGNLVLLAEEKAKIEAEIANRRAKEAEFDKQIAIDLEKIRAKDDKQRAIESEKRKAEADKQRAIESEKRKTKLRTAINMKKKSSDIDFIASVVELDKGYLKKLFSKINI
jgi:Uma2 family endonuclease